MKKIIKLSQEVVNQIAAGEVIERPASVIKELVDNSIDAGATKIEIEINKGGKSSIIVKDNGSGIPRDQISAAFEAHTTSKLTSLDDLNDLLTMGFRGEALSTIVSVSELTVISKTSSETSGTKLKFDGITPLDTEDHPYTDGTMIEVKNLFRNIPARLKYLRTDETEYRNVLKILLPYFLYYPNIHFVLKKDGKVVYNLPSIPNASDNLDLSRITQTIKGEFSKDMLPLFYEGNGISIKGFVARPSYHKSRVQVAYTFLNDRPIQDRGVFKSVLQGFGSYIPHGEKVPYIVSIKVPSSMVDINVHPRKEEVRFTNPFRVYNAIEQAVDNALQKNVTFKDTFESNTDDPYSRLRGDKDTITTRSSERTYQAPKSSSGNQYSFESVTKKKVDSSLVFSENLLSDEKNSAKQITPEDIDLNKEPKNVFQIFNKYIVAEFDDQVWFLDQHAAAERISFETLQSTTASKESVQEFLMPKEVKLEPITKSFLSENLSFFESLGFGLELKESELCVSSVPTIFSNADLQAMFDQILTDDLDNYTSEKGIKKIQDDVLATMACHNSIRSNQSMGKEERLSIFDRLKACKNPYSCPHGRPIIWKLSITEIDSKFYRTY